MHPRESNFPPGSRGWTAKCWRYKPLTHKVFGVICSTEAEKYLLVRGRTGGKWSFPKGHMQEAERAIDCALREFYEETGITLPRENMTYSTVKLSRNRDGNNAEYFRYSVPEEIPLNIIDNNEISEGGWFSLCEMQRLNGNIDVTSFCVKNGFQPIRVVPPTEQQ